jgi:hypothetical protein
MVPMLVGSSSVNIKLVDGGVTFLTTLAWYAK